MIELESGFGFDIIEEDLRASLIGTNPKSQPLKLFPLSTNRLPLLFWLLDVKEISECNEVAAEYLRNRFECFNQTEIALNKMCCFQRGLLQKSSAILASVLLFFS